MAGTLERIAELAGVSRSTVSRVINGDRGVRPATRARVLEVVEREQFEPNRAARGLASGRTGMIGIVMSVDLANLFSDPFFPVLLGGIHAAARDRDLVVSLWVVEEPDDPKTINQIARGSMVDGAIVVAEATSNPIVAALSTTDKPFVLVGRPPDHLDVSHVDVDNRSAGRAVTTHLLETGRRRIATITGPSRSLAAVDRRCGYLDALTAFGLEPRPELIHEADFSTAGAVEGVRALSHLEPDAIVAANDVMAMAALEELRGAGRRVPEDVAVVGFDDLPMAGRSIPPLTTVHQPIELLSSEAVRLLSDLVEDPSLAPQKVVIPTRLIIRASSQRGRDSGL